MSFASLSGVTTLAYSSSFLKHKDVKLEVRAEPELVDVMEIDFDLGPSLELLGVFFVVEISVPDIRLEGGACCAVQFVELREQPLASFEDAPQRDAEAVHGRFHALEYVHAHEVRHGGSAVHLAPEVLTPRVPVAVLVLSSASRAVRI